MVDVDILTRRFGRLISTNYKIDSVRVIRGRTMFLEGGYIKLGVAVGVLMSLKGIEDSVEL